MKRNRRDELPVALAGATNFSDDRAELDVLTVIRLLKSQNHLCNRLVAQTTIVSPNRARPRTPGSWALAYIGFVASGKFADIEPWWTKGVGCVDEFWRECGFPGGRPPYSTVYDRFTELEQFAPEFQVSVSELVQVGRAATGGLVGRDIHVDSCEEETHARLVHDCQDGELCKRGRRDRQTTEEATVRHSRTLRLARAPSRPRELQVRQDGAAEAR